MTNHQTSESFVTLSERIQDVARRFDRVNDTVVSSETPMEIPWPVKRRWESITRLSRSESPHTKLELFDRMMPGVVHDLNNLLAVISGHSELLEMDLALGAKNRHHVEVLRAAISHASSLTSRMLSLAKSSPEYFQAVDLVQIVRELQPLIRAIVGSDIELVIMPSQEALSIYADRVSIEQLILNLVINARDAMTTGGAIGIRTSRMSQRTRPNGDRQTQRFQPYAVLTIADTGPGIDPAIRDRIFEPYFTTKGEAGTGLGLANVQDIVRLCGGEIELHSDPDVGTVFRIAFPQLMTLESRTLIPADTDWTQHAGLTALVVDDDLSTRSTIKTALESVGYNVIESSDGAMAIRLAQVVQESIDLLVTDFVLPGMNGRKLLERMRFTRPGLPTVFVSGYSPVRMDDPATRFVMKPFSRNQLLKEVSEVMNMVSTA